MPNVRESLTYTPVELSFGTSGLRGLVTDMTDLECYINTMGFLGFLQANDNLKAGDTIYIAGDLRTSTPRITTAVAQAILDHGQQILNCGQIPTPALAFFAGQHGVPGIMITGSHIPADRNGIKFYKSTGEVLKADEADIKAAVAAVRQKIYEQQPADSVFAPDGMLVSATDVPAETSVAREAYLQRYTSVFGTALSGLDLVFYQHSAVGRDLLVELLEKLGANVKPVGRSETFVPIDSENVTAENQAYFKQLSSENPGLFAIVSTDGDSDRPFVVDEHGIFHRGDVLGAVTADWLQADFAAYPVSSSDAVDTYLESKQVPTALTKIGSPYVVVAIQQAHASRPVGWEVNGGFLTGSGMPVKNGQLAALPTRDAILPIIIALLAAHESNKTVSELFARLPARFTQAGLIDDFPIETSKMIIEHFSHDTPEVRAEISKYFTAADDFGDVEAINSTDGVRITFSNRVIAHLRPSGNAPQLRIYSVADSQERADEIVAQAIAEPNGIFRNIESDIKNGRG